MGDATPNGFKKRLLHYRAMTQETLLGAVPDKQPKRHLYALIETYLARAGKGLRPALCIATCAAHGGDSERALPSAAGLELLHNAFLVHDDIEDESEMRRDHPTMQREQGLPIAVNTGDAMNALSMRLFRQNMPVLGPALTWRIFDEVDHMLLESLEGQAMELGWIRDNACDVTPDDYLEMSLKKTCWYSFIHPCRIGALAARGEDFDVDRFDRFGYFTGAAFQIQDDVLNLVGDKRYGKEIGGDLYEGKRTLMLAHLFTALGERDSRILTAFLAKPRQQRQPREVEWVQGKIDSHGSIDYARAIAHELTEAAQRELPIAYRDATPGADLDFIERFVDYMVERDV